ncbi:MAG: antibiotic biosynthesis monooxygenase [Haloechinothrix sp.]
MFARSTTVQAHPESIDAGIRHIRDEVMPTLQSIDGCIGLSMLVDRNSGRCIATSAWQSEEAMRASEAELRPVRDHAAEILGGNRAQVDEWEIAVLHRDHASSEGACVRATWVRFEADKLERAIDVYKMAILPGLEEFDGFCSASLLIDRESAIAVSSVTFDSMEAMERSRDKADALRAEGAKEAGVEVLDVCEFELALAHLRVPEMA